MLIENCGLFGIYLSSPDKLICSLSETLIICLQLLQHRGQEAAGIAVSDTKGSIKILKGKGQIKDAIDPVELTKITSECPQAVVSHLRYSTCGNGSLSNCQPLIVSDFVLAQNGNLINYRSEGGKSDTQHIIQFITNLIKQGKSTKQAIEQFMKQWPGAYSLLMLYKGEMWACRDRYGFRPLVLGRFYNNYVICSETPSIRIFNGRYIRDINPGELIHISGPTGVLNSCQVLPETPRFCIFEYVYFSRPDSIYFDNLQTNTVRENLGRQLAEEEPSAQSLREGCDYVACVPDSGFHHAVGFAEVIGLPLRGCLVRNKYMGRSFIQPTNKQRKKTIRLKFSTLVSNITDKNIVLIDDSLVRGNTMKGIVQMLRDRGAGKIHIRIASPPIKNVCRMGIDIPNKEDLVAVNNSIEEIRQFVCADSLRYLSLAGLRKVLPEPRYCDGCFSGKYPVKLEW